MVKEFREFIARGNVLDLAVAVIIGAAFGAIVVSLVQDIINPLIGFVFGGLNFSDYFINLSGQPAASYKAAKDAGLAVIGYGAFITALVNFIIVALVIFLVVKGANNLQRQKTEEEAPKAAELTKDQQLLIEIRDLLGQRRG